MRKKIAIIATSIVCVGAAVGAVIITTMTGNTANQQSIETAGYADAEDIAAATTEITTEDTNTGIGELKTDDKTGAKEEEALKPETDRKEITTEAPEQSAGNNIKDTITETAKPQITTEAPKQTAAEAPKSNTTEAAKPQTTTEAPKQTTTEATTEAAKQATQVWHDPVYETVTKEVPVYKDVEIMQTVYCSICNMCGTILLTQDDIDAHEHHNYRSYQYQEGTGEYETCVAYYDYVEETVLVQEGYWETVYE